jgi:hypothetical protein
MRIEKLILAVILPSLIAYRGYKKKSLKLKKNNQKSPNYSECFISTNKIIHIYLNNPICFFFLKKSLSGAICGFFTGLISVICGFRFTATLISFFISSSFLTKYGSKKKKKIDDEFKEGGQRNWVQVLSNSASATIIGIIYFYFRQEEEIFLDSQRFPLETFLLASFIW